MTANLEENYGVNEHAFARLICQPQTILIFRIKAMFRFFCAKRKKDISCRFIRTKSNYDVENKNKDILKSE